MRSLITILWLVSILACFSKGSSLPVPPFLVQNSYGPPNKTMIRNHCYHQRIICSPQLIVPPPSRWLNSSTISTPVSVSVSYSSLLTIKLYFTTVAIFSCIVSCPTSNRFGKSVSSISPIKSASSCCSSPPIIRCLRLNTHRGKLLLVHFFSLS